MRMQVATIRNSHPVMGSKSFTCAAILPRDEHGEAAAVPRLAIGSADGSIRILNGFKPESLVGVYGSKGGSAVSAMAVVPIHDRDALVTGVVHELRARIAANACKSMLLTHRCHGMPA